MRRMYPEECAVIIIDVQEKLAAAMPAAQLADVTRASTILVEAARILGARVLVTEQYPAGLGPTIAPVAEKLAAAGAAPIAKMTFSACDTSAFERAFVASGARRAVVVGMETHVCVFQTVRELAARGVDVAVPIDGVASRRDDHRTTGLDLCRAAGATLTTTETVVFDWLREAGSSQFKALSKLIR
ncbi:Isochorismatase [Minicystis rosea]|nr:Isochorismatase [Minicystis rosea]